jgi:hypothetical protein
MDDSSSFSQATQPALQGDDNDKTNPLRAGWGLLKGFGEIEQRLLLEEENRDYFLGRHSTCDLILDNALVSNRHCSIARITQREGSHHKTSLTLIRDTSSNGTFVNGKPVGKGNQQVLKHNDTISLTTKRTETVTSLSLCESISFSCGSVRRLIFYYNISSSPGL